MHYGWIPLFSSLTLTGLIGGLWWYACGSTAPAPTWVLASVLVIAFLFTVIGMTFASKTTASKGAKTTYLTGMTLFLAGFASFYLFSQPTTINIFGFITVSAGLIAANLAAGYLYRDDFRQK